MYCIFEIVTDLIKQEGWLVPYWSWRWEVWCNTIVFTLEATVLSETSPHFHQITHSHMPKGCPVHTHSWRS